MKIIRTDSQHDARKLSQIAPGALRCPHFSVSISGALDELSKAQNGVLFLDDLVDWKPAVLGALVGAVRSLSAQDLPLAMIYTPGMNAGEELDDAERARKLANAEALLQEMTR